MDYKTFISGLSRQTDSGTDDTARLVKSLTDAIQQAAAELNTVAIPGFGSFKPVKTEEYVATDPDDQLTRLYPPSVKLQFQCSAKLRTRLNKGKRYE